MSDQPFTLVEPIKKAEPANQSRFGLNPLQQFARAGLELKIGDFRRMCAELHASMPKGGELDDHEIADLLFTWMTETIEKPSDI
jgi:hypothetical protein